MTENNMKSKVGQKIKSVIGRIFKLAKALVLLVLIVALLGGSFAAGIYFKFIDLNKLVGIEGVQKAVNSLKLHDYPVIGKYFTQPRTNFEPVEIATPSGIETQLPLPKSAATAPVQKQVTQPTQSKAVEVTDNKTNEEASQEDAAQKEEEKKRIARLSRLYGEMKAEEAVPILSQLEDSLVVAIFNKMEEDQVSKILARFEPKRAARLTEFMVRGSAKTNPASPDNPGFNPNPGGNSGQGAGTNSGAAPLLRN